MTDLTLARGEIKSLKQECDTLRKRIECVLGDEIREVDRNQPVDRIAKLEHLLRTTQADLAATTKAVATLTDLNQELSEQLDAVRVLNQRRFANAESTGAVRVSGCDQLSGRFRLSV